MTTLTIQKSDRVDPKIIHLPMELTTIVEFDSGTRLFYTKEHGSFSTSQSLFNAEWFITTNL